MTVTNIFDIVAQMTLNHSPDLARPLGQYELVGVVVGDGTGGGVTISHDFSSRYIFSVEGWNMTETLGGTGSDFSLIWDPNVSLGVAWHLMGSGVNDTIIRASVSRDAFVRLPVSNPFVKSGNALLVVSAEVNTNTEIYRANAWGYYWDKRAINAFGGLVRP